MTNVVTDDGAIAQSFDVRYGPLPFALPLVYEPTDEPAVFTRSAFHIGSFPSVVVDVSFDDDGAVDALSEYLCSSVAGVDYEEPAEFWLYKIFEKNLTLAPYEHICKDLISNNGATAVYSSTVSHGIPYIFTATLDLYDPGPV
ncbi:hypothetical protein JL720_15956 [Aureococcus anophagefferens]|nr:hypothetical protein JL720_15956 [Aureococcus anophagefferens]